MEIGIVEKGMIPRAAGKGWRLWLAGVGELRLPVDHILPPAQHARGEAAQEVLLPGQHVQNSVLQGALLPVNKVRSDSHRTITADHMLRIGKAGIAAQGTVGH